MRPLDDEQKGEILHNVMNGLCPIGNYLELLLMGPLTPEETINLIAKARDAHQACVDRVRKEFACSD